MIQIFLYVFIFLCVLVLISLYIRKTNIDAQDAIEEVKERIKDSAMKITLSTVPSDLLSANLTYLMDIFRRSKAQDLAVKNLLIAFGLCNEVDKISDFYNFQSASPNITNNTNTLKDAGQSLVNALNRWSAWASRLENETSEGPVEDPKHAESCDIQWMGVCDCPIAQMDEALRNWEKVAK